LELVWKSLFLFCRHWILWLLGYASWHWFENLSLILTHWLHRCSPGAWVCDSEFGLDILVLVFCDLVYRVLGSESWNWFENIGAVFMHCVHWLLGFEIWNWFGNLVFLCFRHWVHQVLGSGIWNLFENILFVQHWVH
jgi:hypothetical protein